jgi:Domain of Unknown Function (DUF1080)
MKSALATASIIASGFLAFASCTFAQTTEPAVIPLVTINEPAPTVLMPAGMTPIFDGKTLDGWIQDPEYVTTLGGGDITNLPALAKYLTDKSDPVSTFIADHLDDATKGDLTNYTPDDADTSKALSKALAKVLNTLITGDSIYDAKRFAGAQLRPETTALLQQNPQQGDQLARLNRMLLEDAYPKELWTSPESAWTVEDGAIASLGAGRGVLFTKDDYFKYRLMFDMRHVSGKPDHQACFLIFCTRPLEGEKGLDALGGVQFQVPNGGSWDYRPGHNNGGKGEYTKPPHPKFNTNEWSRIEIVVDSKTGTARMAVAQPVDAKAVEVLDFNVPDAGKKGPIALQMHNRGLFDEYANIVIDPNPSSLDLLSTK